MAGVEQMYTGNLLTVVMAQYVQLARRIYSLAIEIADSNQHLAKTIRVK